MSRNTMKEKNILSTRILKTHDSKNSKQTTENYCFIVTQ